jgi:ribonuclease-3
MSIIQNIFNKNSRSSQGGNFFIQIKNIIGFKPKNPEIFITAFTHRSMNKRDDEGHPINYERLEFIGDAMLSAIIATHLYNEVPFGDEGYLTKMRSKIVSREHLNELGKELELINLVESNIPKDNFGDNIHGNLFEALVGAIFLDRGYHFCERFIYNRIIIPHVDIQKLEGKIISYKNLLIEWCQKEKHTFKYEVYDDTGNDDTRHFSVKLHIDSKIVAKGRATSKKKAEEIASKRAFFVFQKDITKVILN